MDQTMYQNAPRPILVLRNISRHFGQGPQTISVLRGASADLWPGQAVALVGPSGAGKSTLLHIAGLLEPPTAGDVFVNGVDSGSMSESERTRARRRDIGFIYQFHQLLPEFTALENVVIPQLILGRRKADAEKRGRALLASLGLEHRGDHRPAELSGGEQQRVAICRGLANAPSLLLADEPTGNLDPKTSEGVFTELIDLIRQRGVAALIATHNMDLAYRMDRVIQMVDGQLLELLKTATV